jgi:hypothetical protein
VGIAEMRVSEFAKTVTDYQDRRSVRLKDETLPDESVGLRGGGTADHTVTMKPTGRGGPFGDTPQACLLRHQRRQRPTTLKEVAARINGGRLPSCQTSREPGRNPRRRACAILVA